MRISDWSSDVCSSDLYERLGPSPVKTTLSTPARPYAGGITTGTLRPSTFQRGSYLPGPHELSCAFCASESAGDSAMIAPGLRSRLGQPSRRCPMPGENESSTVEDRKSTRRNYNHKC